jgi:predicted mannosyl-3-phosphoglycerate phosphatase (HAD superfamily)
VVVSFNFDVKLNFTVGMKYVSMVNSLSTIRQALLDNVSKLSHFSQPKIIDVITFVGEEAVDVGGVRREFWH